MLALTINRKNVAKIGLFSALVIWGLFVYFIAKTASETEQYYKELCQPGTYVAIFHEHKQRKVVCKSSDERYVVVSIEE